MNAQEFVQSSIPHLKSGDSAQYALELMEDNGFSSLPVVDEDIFKGFLNEETLHSLLDDNVEIGKLRLDNQEAFVRQEQHIYDVLRVSFQTGSAYIAVLGENKKYLGTIVVSETLSYFAGMNAFTSPGGVLVLSMEESKYSLGEIGRIIESNGAKILSAAIMQEEDVVGMVRLVLKLNQPDLSRVISALERFQYNIVGQYHESDFESVDKQRLDNLMRYLNI